MGNLVEFCNTNLVLGIGSAANPCPKPTEKELDANDPLSLNLSVGLAVPAAGTSNSWPESSKNSSSNDEEGDNNNGSRKKLRLSKDQSLILEERFKEHSTLNTAQKNNLAMVLNLKPRQVEVWFQNRRARTKLKLTETDCERWKKSCEELTEENTRLKKELAELQAWKMIKERASLMSAGPAKNGTAAADSVCPNCLRRWVESDRGNGGAASFRR